MTKKLCPKCHGVGLIETAIGGHWCRECRGSGFVAEPKKERGIRASGGACSEANSASRGPASTGCQASQGVL